MLLTFGYVEQEQPGAKLVFGPDNNVAATSESPEWRVGLSSTPWFLRERERTEKAVARGVVDLANVLEPSAEQMLAEMTARAAKAGKPTIVVTIIPEPGRSLEQVGWATAAGSSGQRTLILNPENRQVRIEGEMSAESKAEIVQGMRPLLDRGRLTEALAVGVNGLAS